MLIRRPVLALSPRLALAVGLAFAVAQAAAAADAPTRSPAPPPVAAPSPAKTSPAMTLPAGNPVVARVDGVDLHLSDVEAAQQSLPQQAQKLPLPQIYPILLDRLVSGQLIIEAGRKDHLGQDPEVQRRLKLEEDHLIQQVYIERVIKAGETDDRLKARYQAFLKAKPAQDEVHARHILVKTEAEAKSIIAQLDKGGDFAALAKKYSTDPAAATGGDLGYFGRGDMVPGFSAAAFAVPVGHYTETPVKSEFGWHVIYVVDRRVGKPPNLDEAREQVTRLLARDTVEAKLKELRGAAKIETFGLDGKPMPMAN
jgi:peptidyl-prolyl cis-trans isomerase C